MRKLFFCLFIFCSLFIIDSCSTGGGAQPKLKTHPIIIENSDGSKIGIEAEIADTEEQRAKGLMFRKKLNDGEGMLFVFQKDEMLSFWMKNTLLPLSIAYINREFIIVNIFDMYPHNEVGVHSTRSVRYALEVPQGFFERQNIVVGNKLTLP
ncbi:MAG: DUF192 domain-containing protein [Termitinemataceae bacterium]|nr:MAG: DUF192 domain-containing protein [Termitinemataceae bacterium]